MGRLKDLKKREVINMYDGIRLGYVTDLDINMEDGVIEAICVRACKKINSGSRDMTIPYSKIKKVGQTLIIVDIKEDIYGDFLK